MHRIGLSFLVLFLSVCSISWAQVPSPFPPPNLRQFVPIPHFPTKQAVPLTPPIPLVFRRPEATRLPALATPDASQNECAPYAADLGAVCGYVNVPFDRKQPNKGTIPIYFELYQHSNAGPAVSALLVNFGGPGSATTIMNRWNALNVFWPNLDAHDILLIDDRGRGLSNTIVCDSLQHGIGPLDQAIADCAAQLGDGASRYGTGDIAKDTDAVRAALGYDKVDYFGASYGGADVTAYATRFGKHLRSLVLDAPVGTPYLDRFAFDRYRTHAESRMVSLECMRSPTCSLDHPFPYAEFDALVWTIRAHPIEGDAHDAFGNPTHVRIDESNLLNYVIDNPTGTFNSTGEILAAAGALWRGDSKPLLRLGAESFYPIPYDTGDPTNFSYGARLATGCVDAHQPWDWSEAVPERLEQYAEAVSDLPPNYFAPFSNSVPTDEPFTAFGKPCIWWQKPTPSSPLVESGATYPHVPTLVLDGDMDNRVPLEETSKVASFFPNSTFVPVAEVGHVTVFGSSCAINLASLFVETLQVGDLSCTRTPQQVWAAVGRFPLLARDARPADIDPSGHNAIGISERKVARVAVATATDAMMRTILIYFSGGWAGGTWNGAGLRAGTFQVTFNGGLWTTVLTDCAFAKDVTVNGTAISYPDGSFGADLVVSGPGTAGGNLHVDGYWWVPGPVGNFTVTGTLGGEQVAVLIPEE